MNICFVLPPMGHKIINEAADEEEPHAVALLLEKLQLCCWNCCRSAAGPAAALVQLLQLSAAPRLSLRSEADEVCSSTRKQLYDLFSKNPLLKIWLLTANGWPPQTYLTVFLCEIQTAVRLLAMPFRMQHSLFGARWPECCVGHDTRR